jgi:aspartyl-tRNA(Asn)/glutamyl-tRNA(Gln) amidotransferase subunit B
MRGKEDAHDYRYFPDPDLMPVVLDAARIAAWRAEMPEHPSRRRERLIVDYGIPAYDAGVLAAGKAIADFYEAAARVSGNPKAVSNWMMTEMLRLLSEKQIEVDACKLSPGALAELVELTDRKTINSNSAKEVFAILFEQGGKPADIVAQRGLAQVSDTGALAKYVDQVIAENAKSATDYRNGKTAAAKFLVGQVMRLTKGTANPQAVMQMIEEKLKTC